MSKPIQKGCRAVIVNSVNGNNGMIVTVGNFIGVVEEEDGMCFGKDRWEVSPSVKQVRNNRLVNHIQEIRLERIDDYDGDELTSWKELEHIWTPEKETANGYT